LDEKCLLIRGGNVWTGDRRNPRAEAVLVRGERILAVGTANQLEKLEGAKGAQVLDLAGETVIPGMTDAHLHLLYYAKQRAGISLFETKSLAEALQLLKKGAEGTKPGDWVHGVRYNDAYWVENRAPTRHDLDATGIDRPILLTRVCTHVQVANSAALAAAGMPEDHWGDGILLETEVEPVLRALEAWRSGSGRTLDMIEEACRDFARYGVTEIQTCSASGYGLADDLAPFQRLRIEGRLPIRVVLFEDRMPQWNVMSGLGDDWVRYGGFKLFLDGSLGGRTAALSSPYADDPGTCGMLNHEEADLLATARVAHKKGLQMLIHAIGDRALDQAIRAIGAAYSEGPCPCGLPHRVNHVMICRPDQLEAMKKLGVILDVQPAFVPGEIAMATARLGEERVPWTYSWKSFVDSGLVVTGSSDCPVEPPTPWRGVWGALCRVGDDGTPEGGWQPHQKLTLEEALELWTVNGAVAVGEGGRRGRIAPGYLADIAVLDRDIFKADPMALKDVEAHLTLAGGRVTHGGLPGWPAL
jgi:hypothetical protein